MRYLNTKLLFYRTHTYLRPYIDTHTKQALYIPVLLSFYSIVPESPRWLLSNGKRDEAEQVIKKLAKRNGKIVTDEMLSSLEADKHRSKGRLWQLFSTKTLAFRTTVIFINW